LKDGPKTLVGHIDMHLFRFFVDFIRLVCDAIQSFPHRSCLEFDRWATD
jgi:hypothetical protein